jgi:hypothetical protein
MSSRTWWWIVLAVFAAGFQAGLWAESLIAKWQGEVIRISAPRIRFLAGRTLQRLKNGGSIPVDAQLTLLAENRTSTLRRTVERCIYSYDLWEERFSVVALRMARRSGGHLNAGEAEAWCLDALTLPTGGVAPETTVWVRLELRVDDGRSSTGAESSVSLAGLIDLFSRPARAEQTRHVLESGPFRLRELR